LKIECKVDSLQNPAVKAQFKRQYLWRLLN
jgi:hypothetical protein